MFVRANRLNASYVKPLRCILGAASVSSTASPIDNMLENMQDRQRARRPPTKTKSYLKQNSHQPTYSKSWEPREAKPNVRDSRVPQHHPHYSSRQTNHLVVKTPPVRNQWLRVDSELSKHLQALLDKSESRYAFQLFQQGVMQLIVPQFEVLTRLAVASVTNRNAQILDSVQSIARLIYPEDFEKFGGFKIHQAELLWTSFKYKEACDIFRDLYLNYPNMRRKLRNMYSFMVAHAVTKHDNSDLEFKHVEDFAGKLAREHDDIQPLVTLWKHCVKSPWFRHQSVAMQAEEHLENDEEFRHLLVKRIENILGEERPVNETFKDLLHRLVQTALKLELTDIVPSLMGRLLETQCILRRYKEADETMKLSRELKILLPYQNCAVYAIHLRKRKLHEGIRVPDELKEPKIVPPKTLEFPF